MTLPHAQGSDLMRELTLDRLPRKTLAQLDLETVFVASRAVVAAERLLVFRKLHGRELSPAAVGKRAGIHPRHCESFLDFHRSQDPAPSGPDRGQSIIGPELGRRRSRSC